MRVAFIVAFALFLNIPKKGLSQSAASHYNGPIIDMHVHVAVETGESTAFSPERTNTIEDVIAFMPKLAIKKAAVITMAHKGDLADTRIRNDSIVAICKKYHSLIPICSVHPFDGPAALSEMERVNKLGVRIIKLHPNSQHFDVGAPEVDSIAHQAGRLHMILLFDSFNPWDANEIGKLILLAVKNPDAKFIFAHMGLVNFPQLLTIEGVKKNSWYKNNIWMDLSAIAPLLGDSPFRDQLVWVIKKIGISQFLYGSDFPIFSPEESIRGVHAMGFSAEDEKKIFYTNAVQLLEIK